jgi:molybdopterin converting factor small subunit
MLVDLQRRSWGGKKTDKSASSDVIAARGASRDSGRFVKNLLAGADAELKAVQQLNNAVGAFVYSRTLPWSGNSDGTKRGDRLIAATQSFTFLKELNNIKREYDAAVQRLMLVWDQRVAEAQANLGGLMDQSDDYPTAADLPERFAVTVDLRPVPHMNDFARVNVPSELAEALGQRHAQMAAEHVANAMDDLKKRLLEQLQRMAAQLAKAGAGEKTRLYDSLVTNLQELVSLTRVMNVNDNPGLKELADKIEVQLLSKSVETYRNSPTTAAAVAVAANTLAVEAAIEGIWS